MNFLFFTIKIINNKFVSQLIQLTEVHIQISN